jgi:hypothetical protein
MADINLTEAVKTAMAEKNFKKAELIQNFIENSPLMARMPFITVSQGAGLSWNEEQTLPTAEYRALNGTISTKDGETKSRQEELKILSSELGVDDFVADQYGSAVKTEKEQAQMKAIRLKVENDLFNGSSLSNNLQFDGLAAQIGSTAGQNDRGYVVDNGTAALSQASLDEALDNIEDSDGQVLIMNKTMRSNIGRYSQSLFDFEQDEFGRRTAFYAERPVLTVDKNDLLGQILGFNEAGNTTSIYALNLGLNEVAMLQGNRGLKVTEQGRTKGSAKDSWLVEWYISLAVQGKFNAARIKGITDAVMTV